MTPTPNRFFEAIHGVYFDDLDAFRILHNARYLLYFERTIGAFWRHLGYGRTFENAHPDQVQLVRANHIEYHQPFRGLGEVRIRIWVEKLGKTSLTFGCTVMPMDEDVNCATAERVMVKVDPVTRKPVEWSEDFRAKIAPYVRA